MEPYTTLVYSFCVARAAAKVVVVLYISVTSLFDRVYRHVFDVLVAIRPGVDRIGGRAEIHGLGHCRAGGIGKFDWHKGVAAIGDSRLDSGPPAPVSTAPSGWTSSS